MKAIFINKLFFLLALSASIISCKPTAESIVEETITAHGGQKYEQCDIEFDFRDMHYRIQKNGGDYTYTRTQKDSTGNVIMDVVNNAGFERLINNEKTTVADTMAAKYMNSVNSVAYFFLLPKPLQDPAVNKTLLGESTIKGQTYHKIKVTFSKENGGKDFNDEFLYWINKETKFVDYLAYSYETNGGGVRFREAFNPQTQNGIRYVDYRNYGYEDLKTPIEDLDKDFESGKMPLKSEIVNQNVVVK
ncbi:DUF6503 family protein [Lacihabitans lacunae]|uniref:DUF6503 family protein n=1 Tax=Lacihabitans lacunae TaxID=1028214 RepID=A0ABV7YVD1_9BACT